MLPFQTCCDVECDRNAKLMRFGIWRGGVECGVLVCGMLHNTRCGKSRDVKCGGEECGTCGIVLCDCCGK